MLDRKGEEDDLLCLLCCLDAFALAVQRSFLNHPLRLCVFAVQRPPFAPLRFNVPLVYNRREKRNPTRALRVYKIEATIET